MAYERGRTSKGFTYGQHVRRALSISGTEQHPPIHPHHARCLYKVRLKHASLNSTYLDKMQVMIGTPGHEQPVEMTRTSVNGHGDKLNEKSTTIATKVSNTGELDRNHENQWETYEARM